MKKLVTIAVLLLVAASVIFVGCKGDSKVITVATDATWPPMEYVNMDKEIVGFDIDLMKLVAEEGKFEVEFVNTAWDGIFGGLKNGDYDAIISSVTITPERKEEFDFSDPYINAGQVLIVRNDTSGVETIADLKGKLLESVGSGASGFLDGGFDDAQFSRPQGMEISADGRRLYVADRENHSIRAIDLESKLVSTIAGTGEPTNRFTSGFGEQTPLASP